MATKRITYNSLTIDIPIVPAGLRVDYEQNVYDNISGSGRVEAVNLYGIQHYNFSAIFDEDTYHDLIAWWSWARQRKEWSFTMDTGKMTQTYLDAAAASGQKVIPVAATAGFSVGEDCFIRNESQDNAFEIIEIDSINAGVSVTAVENLKNSYVTGDVFRHWQYFPRCISEDTVFNPTIYEGTTTYYKHTFNFLEVLPASSSSSSSSSTSTSASSSSSESTSVSSSSSSSSSATP